VPFDFTHGSLQPPAFENREEKAQEVGDAPVQFRFDWTEIMNVWPEQAQGSPGPLALPFDLN